MVYSAIPDGSYDMDAGTSMATPHAAGATALIKQALEQRFPNYSPEQIHTLLRQLVKSTAKPHFDQGKQELPSVRQQGSGLMDAAAAAFGDVFVTGGKGTNSSLTLGNVKDSSRLMSLCIILVQKQKNLPTIRSLIRIKWKMDVLP